MGAYISPFREGDDAMTKPRKQLREYHRMPEARRLFGNYTPLAKSTLRALKALARNECANCYDDGRQCVMTDKPCFQINASGVACKYFKQCVLPLDKELYATLIQRTSLKNCPRCGNDFFPTNNRQIYCHDCGAIERKKKTAERVRKRREKLAAQNRDIA